MTLYATLDEVQSVMTASSTAATAAEKNKILSDLRVISRRIDREFQSRRPLFAPYSEARTLRVNSILVNRYDGTLRLTDPLLALTGVSIATTALVVDTHVEAWPDTTAPIGYLRLINCTDYSWYHDPGCADCGGPLTVTITGTWGLHRDYANAWMKVDDLQATITDSATTLTVAVAAGADAYGVTPRLSPGNLIKIDSELLEVTAVSTNTLTVRRGVNGSTAAAHTGAASTAGADIYTWQVEEPIRRAVARQAALMYARRGAYTTVEVQGMSEVRFPADFLGEVRAILNDYSYLI
jgi:hypothetical protein